MLFIFTGGGWGIMEAANRGAYGAGYQRWPVDCAADGKRREPLHAACAVIPLHYFAVRKMVAREGAGRLLDGFGTLDELFEVITLGQTRKFRSSDLSCCSAPTTGSSWWISTS